MKISKGRRVGLIERMGYLLQWAEFEREELNRPFVEGDYDYSLDYDEAAEDASEHEVTP